MNKDELMVKVLGFAGKVQGNKYLTAISQGLMQTLPILMIGSIALLLAVLPIDAWQGLITDLGIKAKLLAGSTLTTSLIALYSCFCIGYQLAIQYKQDGIAAGLISVFSFLVLTPLNEGALDTSWLSAQGLFAAMIASLVCTRIYVLCIEKNLTIKMPEGVPGFVQRSFQTLFPAIISGAVAMVASFLFGLTSYGSFAQMIYSVVAIPLQGLSGNVWSLVFIVFIQMILWFFGIHGSLVVGSFITALYLPMDTANMDALAAGLSNSELPHILGKTFYGLYAGIGGAGGTLSLLIVILIFAKAKKNKTLGKLAIVPGCFTINEPVVFGYPLILNPIMAIPFIITPLVQILVAYAAIAVGLVPRLTGIQVPFGMPILLNGFMAGGWQHAILQIICIAIGVAIWFPFFKLSDKKDYELELSGEVTGT